MPQTRSIYSLAGEIGGYARAARHDGREMTDLARLTFIESFLDGHSCRICPPVVMETGLLPDEHVRRAEALRHAHYARMALVSAQARRERRGRRTPR